MPLLLNGALPPTWIPKLGRREIGFRIVAIILVDSREMVRWPKSAVSVNGMPAVKSGR